MITARQVLIYLSLKYEGNWDKIYNAIKTKEDIDSNEIGKIVISNAITIVDDNYPQGLKTQYKPPFVLFYKGNKEILDRKNILGVVGTRKMSTYGRRVTDYLLSGVYEKKDIPLVSGMAKGIDSEAARVAIRHNKQIISCVGCGLDYCYPQESRDVYDYSMGDNGVIISEYPEGVKPLPENFPLRNRIIAGLCEALLVVEAGKQSGTSITVKYAIDQGKEVLCVPNEIFSKNTFTNELIACGALPCSTSNEIIGVIKDE